MGSQKFSSLSEQHLERLALEFGPQEIERDTTMKTTTKNTGIKVTANVKSGAINPNHSRVGLMDICARGATSPWFCSHLLTSANFALARPFSKPLFADSARLSALPRSRWDSQSAFA